MREPAFIEPQWPAPPNVRALTSTRGGGVSSPPFDTLNLGARAGDLPEAVARNRDYLGVAAGLPGPPVWLAQCHGTIALPADRIEPDVTEADAVWTGCVDRVVAVLTADCLPVLLCDRSGTHVAAVHAGWRGLAAGVVESAIAALPVAADRLLAWLGPAISAEAFEVGTEVRDAFLVHDPDASDCFHAGRAGHCQADLYALARRRLAAAGVPSVHGGEHCTVTESDRFFSYRRDGRTGRMATLIWRVNPDRRFA